MARDRENTIIYHTVHIKPCSFSDSTLTVPVQMGGRKRSSSADDTYISSESDLDLAPDGGWGWMVCFGAFMINFIIDGTMTSFGVIILELLECYGETKAKTAWVGSTLFGTSMVMGPMVGFLLERYTCRQVTIAGSLVSAIGFISSMFAPNILVLIFTYGVIGGIGFCMMFITAIIAISLYFTRKRAIATGIAMSGGGMGIFVYGYLCDYLLYVYNWQNTLLILAGILLNCCVFGALFRPLIDRKSVFSPKSNTKTCTCLSNESSSSECSYDEITPQQKMNIFNSLSRINSGKLNYSDYALHVDSDDFLYGNDFSSAVNIGSGKDKATIGYLRPMMRKDIFYSGSIHTLPSVKDARSVSSIVVSLTKDCTDSEMSSEESSVTSLPLDNNWKRGLQRVKKYTSQKFRLFSDLKFDLLLISCILWTAQSTVVTYLPDMAGTKNIPRSQCALLISVVGISNTVARFVAGFVTDVLHVPSTYLYTLTLFLAAGVNFALPWCEMFELLVFCAAVFGFCMGSIIALRTIVITDHLGIEKLTRAFGIIAMFQGVAFLLNPPLGGLVFDLNASYIYPFVMVGVMYLLSAMLCLPLLRKRPDQRRNSFDVVLTDTQVIEPLVYDKDINRDVCKQNLSLNSILDEVKTLNQSDVSLEQVKCPSG